jgi:hypothetical protein
MSRTGVLRGSAFSDRDGAVREVATRLWRGWAGPQCESVARTITLAACGLLFLQAAATIEIVYTVRPSDVLLLLACGIGAPVILRGWWSMSPTIRWLALGLVAAYVLATALADTTVLPSEGRSSGYRSLVYLADLLFGLAVLGLIYGLWGHGESLRPLCWSLAAGAAIAATYGIYQWFAQRHGLPLDDVNNAVNTDGITFGGGHSQGKGILGGNRIRGTFVEPSFLATFLASMLPFAAVLAYGRPSRYRWAVAAGVVISIALVLTSSAPAWAELVAGALVGIALVGIARGRVRVAAAACVALAIGALLTAFVFAHPAGLSSATGRSATELEGTTDFRLKTWDRVIDIWASRPLIGFGPGQGAVKLAGRLPSYAVHDSPPPLVLGTASGLWSASLLDGGVLAFSAWLGFLGAIVYAGARAVLRRPSPLVAAIFVAVVIALLGTEISGDRLDLRVWVLLGMLAAVSGAVEADQRDGEGAQLTA